MSLLSTSNCSCTKIVSICVIIVITILVLDCKFTILPIHGYILGFYIVSVFLLSAWIAFVSLQRILQQNKPFEINFEKVDNLTIVRYIFEKLVRYLLTGKYVSEKETPERTDFKLNLSKDKPWKEDYLKSRTTIDDRIEEFVTDVEQRFIIKWYRHISTDLTFLTDTKNLLDEITRRFLQVVVEIDNKKLTYGLLAIFLNHIKEFRKAIKRVEKNGGAVEDMYRYIHVVNKSTANLEMYVYWLTTDVLKQFISWELYSSLPCKIMVSVLSKKVITFLLTFLSSPGFINYKILQLCLKNNKIKDINLSDYGFVILSDVDLRGKQEDRVDSDGKQPENKNIGVEKITDESCTPKKSVVEKKSKDKDNEKLYSKEEDVVDSFNVEFKKCVVKPKTKPVSEEIIEDKKVGEVTLKSTSTKIKKSEPVKIYESKSANKTWRNSSDLQCISLGQDLLALQDVTDPDSQIQTLIEKKLWKDNTESIEDEEKTEAAWESQEHLSSTANVATMKTNFGANYSKAMTNTTSLISSTIKPIGNVTASTLHNMKEFQQNTVNTVVRPVSQATSNAMHKIENLQDEAAGVVEGILDFGIAGLKKGLRLTGLQDNFSDLTGKNKQEPKLETVRETFTNVPGMQKAGYKLKKIPHVTSEDDKTKQMMNTEDSEESVWINPLKESPNFDGNILLEKTPEPKKSPKHLGSVEKASTSALEKHDLAKKEIPQITEEVLVANDSPELEYEEAADFETTIAKLRTLLQQKSSESGMSTPSLSPMPQDDVNKPSDLQSIQAIPDSTKVDGAMPSLYKFCARTATGVFQNTLNTIKTALPGNIGEQPIQGLNQDRDTWTFVEANAFSDDFLSRMEKLISERRAFCTVDTAYEAINSLDVTDHPESVWTGASFEFDADESDEFGSRIPITKTLVDIVCELISDSDTYLIQEPIIKIVLLLLGNSCENFFSEKSETFLYGINKYVGKLPQNPNDNTLQLKLDEMVQICSGSFPSYLKTIFGERTLHSAMRLLILSLQSHKINQNLLIQIFELCASELILANNKFTPAYSA